MENKKFYVIVAFVVFVINIACLLWLGWLNYDVMSKWQVFGFVLLGVLNLPLFVLCKPFPSLAWIVEPQNISRRATLEHHSIKISLWQLCNMMASLLLLSPNLGETRLLPIEWMFVLLCIGNFLGVVFEKVTKNNKPRVYCFRLGLFFCVLLVIGNIYDWNTHLRMVVLMFTASFLVLGCIFAIIEFFRKKHQPA